MTLKSEKDNYPKYIEHEFMFNIPIGQTPERLDVFLTNSIRNATRNKVQKAIDDGCVLVNGMNAKANRKIKGGDEIICRILKPPPIELVPEDIPLNIVYEDAYLLVINKPSGMVTHPAFGNRYGTLVNAVLYYLGYRENIKIEIEDSEESEESNTSLDFFSSSVTERPGVVHRLDKETSGLILFSKNAVVHSKLAEQFANRTVEKYYQALVWGVPKSAHGIIENNIGRSPRDRKLFAVVKKDGKFAKTEFWVEKQYQYNSLLKIKLWTGRTHQIRVHLSYLNCPILGDEQYSGNTIRYGGENPAFKRFGNDLLDIAKGQFLHAYYLKFRHPILNKDIELKAEFPQEFAKALDMLESFGNLNN